MMGEPTLEQWWKDHERARCTCPICGTEQNEYVEECCDECADYELWKLDRYSSLVPDWAREKIVNRLLEDDAEELWNWANGRASKKDDVVAWIYDRASKREKELIEKRIEEAKYGINSRKTSSSQ